MTVAFIVYGDPTPQGSKTKMPNGAMLEGGTADLRTKRINWRNAVADKAAEVLADQCAGERMDGDLVLSVAFRFPMPASRPATVRKAGTGWKNTAPDLDKLIRSVGDSLTSSGLIRDDARIVCLTATKVETTDWSGVSISLHQAVQQ